MCYKVLTVIIIISSSSSSTTTTTTTTTTTFWKERITEAQILGKHHAMKTYRGS
jgi:hypothetical protein